MFFCETGVGLIEPYWSDLVVHEATDNIFKNTGDDASERFEKMNLAYPYANVIGFEELEDISGVHLNDQHVAKAAIFNECDFLLTNNIKHFKSSSELQTKLKVVTPDTLLSAFVKKHLEESFRATSLAWWHLIDDISFDGYLFLLKNKVRGLGFVNFTNHLDSYIHSLGLNYVSAVESVLKHEHKRY